MIAYLLNSFRGHIYPFVLNWRTVFEMFFFLFVCLWMWANKSTMARALYMWMKYMKNIFTDSLIECFCALLVRSAYSSCIVGIWTNDYNEMNEKKIPLIGENVERMCNGKRSFPRLPRGKPWKVDFPFSPMVAWYGMMKCDVYTNTQSYTLQMSELLCCSLFAVRCYTVKFPRNRI